MKLDKFKMLVRSLRGGFDEVRGLGPRFWKGALWGLLSFLLIFYGMAAYTRVAPPTPSLGSFLAVLTLTAQMLIVGTAILVGLRLLARLPGLFTWILACGLVFLYYHFGRFEGSGMAWTVVAVILPPSLLGGSLSILRSKGRGGERIVALVGTVVGGLTLVFVLIYFFRPGFPGEVPVNAALMSEPGSASLELPNPSEPGKFPVKSLQYGSGADRHRREFAEGVDWVTEPVDGSAFIDGWEKRSGWARTQYWGFDAERLPLQGRVWTPDGEGPFPLVLVVHGNHAMEDFSDPGYGYLGELFASRGIIMVSVDENFINSSFSGRLNGLRGRGLKEENDARGWILLEHLRRWSEWNEDPDHPFFGRIDLGRIGLIGHSRGGEAVAVAAAFSQLPHYPDDATIRFDYDFSIRAVAAIAPVDGQYKPAGLGTDFDDVDYFVLHGSHDGDVQSFAGSRQFERVRFSGDRFRFKSSLYIYGANHGQFNTTWGRTDSSFPHKNFLNLSIIMPPEDQARIAKVYLSAFFEIALRDENGYLPLFRDFRRGARWLPDTIYLTHYEDSTHRVVSNFEEDRNVVTATFPGGSQSGENLTVWKEQLVELKHGDKATNAVYLGWNRDAIEEIASFTIQFPVEGLSTTETDTLVFTLADAKEKSNPKKLGSEKSDEAEEEEKEPVPIDLSVELRDRGGVTARLPLAHFSLLQPQIEVQVRKADVFNTTKKSEPVFQSFAFPLADFIAVSPELDVANLDAIRFVFDRSEEGVVILDNLAFRPSITGDNSK